MTKELIIIAVIICLIYYYYQQNQPNLAFDKVGYDNLIKDLKRQVQHYQKLYEDRVAKDISSVKQNKSVEIQTDNFIGESKETQTPSTLKYSHGTQTSLTNDNIDKLVSQ